MADNIINECAQIFKWAWKEDPKRVVGYIATVTFIFVVFMVALMTT